MRCREIATLLDSDAVQALKPVDRIQLRVHVWVCWQCRLLMRQIRWLRHIAREQLQEMPGEAGMESRVLKRLL
jgi:hypothetical protein